jgi:hypothetical protein
VAQGFLALGPLGPTLGVFGLGMFVGAKTQIVTMGKRMVEIVGKKDGQLGDKKVGSNCTRRKSTTSRPFEAHI